MKGPAIFLAQFASNQEPFNSLEKICGWAAEMGYKGIQIPIWEPSLIDIEKAAQSKTYAEEIKGIAAEKGISITELSSHLQGQLIAVHPAYDDLYDGFAPAQYRGNSKARTEWAKQQLIWSAKASANLGLKAHGTFSGALMWHLVYPWPQRPHGLVKQGFKELAKRWLPILRAFDENGVDLCYEIHPGEDLHDGITYELFLEACGNHPRACILYDPSHFILQQLDYLQYIDYYHEKIKMFHVKDAEFRPSGKSGVYGGYQAWIDRPGRFRSLGDGSVDFKSIFSKLYQYNFDSWAVLEWECCLKENIQGAREGAEFIKDHMMKTADKNFDDFSSTSASTELNNKILGIE